MEFGTIFIDNNDTLYMCGTWYNSSNTQVKITQPRVLMNNVKEAEIINREDTIFIITNEGEIIKNIWLNNIKVDNMEKDKNAIFLFGQYILSNQKIYEIGLATSVISANLRYSQLTEIEKISNEKFLYGNNKNMLAFNANGKIYINAEPNITKIGEKSNYKLKKIFENVIFISGKGENISIVDKEKRVYERVDAQSLRNDVKKIIASNLQKFIITSDKHIYAKGDGVGAMWGDIQYKSEYIELRDKNGNAFDNVKNVFTSSTGRSMIFQTENNELYFGGNVEYITFPRNKRRFTSCKWNFNNRISTIGYE